MAEIITYVLSDYNRHLCKVELVQRILRKMEITGGINFYFKVKWCRCNWPLVANR